MKNYLLKGRDRDGNEVTWADYGWSGADATEVSLEDCARIMSFQGMVNENSAYHKAFEAVTDMTVVMLPPQY